ncbi:MAG: hypothetical protein M1825_000395 [Sarcosagium campestre]|nr:MAG: hypothetical protein M1825_000395 [Sarcosagium campestre]
MVSSSSGMNHEIIINRCAPGISYFTPAQDPPSGTASDPQPDGSKPPKLFQPLKLRGLTLHNRITLSPLCQYSAEDGHLTDWHFAHLGGIISRGPGLSFVEATAVSAEGRITPEDSGLWKDSQIAPLRRIVEFAHSQGQKIGIQLAGAGRKASTVAPWLNRGLTATEAARGWPNTVQAPSAVAYNDQFPSPHEMSIAEIEQFKIAWAAAVQRALKAGFDVIEIHNAHGYLLHEFNSPVSNRRTDHYGGSFENRIRLTREIVHITRRSVPSSMPVFLRISGTDWLENDSKLAPNGSWDVEQTVRLASLLADEEDGIDLLDVSSGGNHPGQKIQQGPAYQARFAKAVKDVVGDKLAVASVGSITSATLAESLLQDRAGLDMVMVGRGFQKNPGLVLAWAEELGIEVGVASQIAWG